MRLTFQLRFHTHPGQSLLLSGNHPILGNEDPAKAIPLSYLNDEFWQVTLILPTGTAPNTSISYYYLLREADGTFTEDCGRCRSFNPASLKTEETLIVDSWNAPGFYENAFYTEPFDQVLLRQN